MNISLLNKQIWRIYRNFSIAKRKAYKYKYLDTNESERIFTIEDTPYGSPMRNNLKKKDKKYILKIFKWEVCNDTKIEFWHDP